mmetsp:Transcript_23808/g.20743  ORF Transcript_23808/g.20743 Transcript_23808/m.20743 type:complete len:202 (+) Transcript_23808:1231-1836(+)
MIFKWIALGFRGYFMSNWNKFDCFVVFSSIVDLLMEQLGSQLGNLLRVGPQLARILRVLRVSRLFRLAKNLQGIAALIETMITSIPSLVNVFALLFLIFFIYSVLGVFLLRDIKYGENIIGDYANFANFGNAMTVLFRCSTGEDWHRIMFETMKTNDCTPGYNCGSSANAVFFITFVVLLQFIMLNVFILILLETFDENYF